MLSLQQARLCMLIGVLFCVKWLLYARQQRVAAMHMQQQRRFPDHSQLLTLQLKLVEHHLSHRIYCKCTCNADAVATSCTPDGIEPAAKVPRTELSADDWGNEWVVTRNFLRKSTSGSVHLLQWAADPDNLFETREVKQTTDRTVTIQKITAIKVLLALLENHKERVMSEIVWSQHKAHWQPTVS